jgi:hypothetical protein
MRHQCVRRRAHPGLEGVRLFLYQIRVAPRPEQLQLKFQFQKKRQGGNQCRPGPPVDPVSSRGVDLALEQLHRHGQ